MSDDPFAQFSNIFASEFAKQAGAAAINAWQEALKSSFSAAGVDQDPLGIADGFKKRFGGDAASPTDFFQQFVQQFPGAGTSGLGAGSNYLQFAEFMQKYLDMYSAGVDPSKIAEQMSSAFQQSLDQLSSLSSTPWMNLFNQFTQGADFTAPFKSLTEMFQHSSLQEGFSANDFFSRMAKFGPDDFAKVKINAAVGPAREWQIAAQDVIDAAERHRSAQARMQQHTATTFDGASQLFWQQLGHGEQELKSIREIYDFWVNCAEEAYANNVMTDEYSRDFGESINSQANLKLKFTALLSRFFEMLNIPNRREIDGLIQNISNIDRRLEEVEQGSSTNANDVVLNNAAAISDLKKEIELLRAELANRDKLSAAVSTPPAKKRKNKKRASDSTRDIAPAKKTSKPKTDKKRQKNKPKDSKANEFEIAKITSAN